MKIDYEVKTSMILSMMKCFLNDINAHIQDAQESVENDPNDIFHQEMIYIFSAAKNEFYKLFKNYFRNKNELGYQLNQLLVDKIFRFVSRYNAKKDSNILYGLVGEMLEDRISIICIDENDHESYVKK